MHTPVWKALLESIVLLTLEVAVEESGYEPGLQSETPCSTLWAVQTWVSYLISQGLNSPYRK